MDTPNIVNDFLSITLPLLAAITGSTEEEKWICVNNLFSPNFLHMDTSGQDPLVPLFKALGAPLASGQSDRLW